MKRLSSKLAITFLIILIAACYLLPLFVELDPLAMDPQQRLAPPSAEHLLGKDEFGRDLFARIIFGGRISLNIAFAVSTITLILGLVIGIYAAVSPSLDRILMRILDALMSIPAILLALALMTIFSASVGNVILALCVVYTPMLARVARSATLKIKNENYIEIYQVAGLEQWQILLRHILPNMIGPILVQSGFIFADAIISEAALSFLGAGIPAKEASWGNIISSGKLLLNKAPHMIIIPSLLIFFLLLAVNAIADELLSQSESSASLILSAEDIQKISAGNASKSSEVNKEEPSLLLEIKNLSIHYPTVEGAFCALEDFNLSLNPGEVVAVVGESGSGKSSLCNAALRLFEAGKAEVNGEMYYQGKEILKLAEKDFASYRGREIAMVFQDPTGALDPVFTIEHELAELFTREERKAPDFRRNLHRLLAEVGISEAERILKAYPHELSGGLKQRVLIAIALARKPKVLLADEVTSALDVSTQKGIMELLAELKDKGLSMIFITHDLSLLENFADKIIVLKKGVVVERADSQTFFHSPQHSYAKNLLAAIPSLELGTELAASHNPEEEHGKDAILSLNNINKTFVKHGTFGKKSYVKAVNEVSFSIQEGSCTALVGESASGKTTCGRLIVRLEQPDKDSGSIIYKGQNLLKADKKLQQEVQMIFQHPLHSFDPRQKIDNSFIEMEEIAGLEASKARRVALLERMGMSASDLNKYPHEFSGGQEQRLAIARALLLKPKLLILDESLSGLDVLVQEKIMDLLKQIKEEEKLTYLFITHDLRAVRQLADQIVVLKNGQVREISDNNSFFSNPQDSYSQSLLEAIPKLGIDRVV